MTSIIPLRYVFHSGPRHCQCRLASGLFPHTKYFQGSMTLKHLSLISVYVFTQKLAKFKSGHCLPILLSWRKYCSWLGVWNYGEVFWPPFRRCIDWKPSRKIIGTTGTTHCRTQTRCKTLVARALGPHHFMYFLVRQQHCRAFNETYSRSHSSLERRDHVQQIFYQSIHTHRVY